MWTYETEVELVNRSSSKQPNPRKTIRCVVSFTDPSDFTDTIDRYLEGYCEINAKSRDGINAKAGDRGVFNCVCAIAFEYLCEKYFPMGIYHIRGPESVSKTATPPTTPPDKQSDKMALWILSEKA